MCVCFLCLCNILCLNRFISSRDIRAQCRGAISLLITNLDFTVVGYYYTNLDFTVVG